MVRAALIVANANKKEAEKSTSFLLVGATSGRPRAYVPLGNAEGHRPYKSADKILDTSFWDFPL